MPFPWNKSKVKVYEDNPEVVTYESKITKHYDLSHLNGPVDQAVEGPIQDDEALFLYSIVIGMRLKRILEIGGLGGYSAVNFLKAIGDDGVMYTVDINPIRTLADNHIFIHKNANDIVAKDIDNKPIELLFFDCHDYDAQMNLFNRLTNQNMINDNTIIVLHDTNTHPKQFFKWAYQINESEWVHQDVERKMVNYFHDIGYNIFSLHTDSSKHNDEFPYRHGITVCQKFRYLKI